MTKSFATVEANQDVVPRTARHTSVSREKFIGLMLSRQNLERFDDHLMELCGLMDRATGDSFIIEKVKLFGR